MAWNRNKRRITPSHPWCSMTCGDWAFTIVRTTATIKVIVVTVSASATAVIMGGSVHRCPGDFCYVHQDTNEQVCQHCCQAGYNHTDHDKYQVDVPRVPCTLRRTGKMEVWRV